MNKERRNVLSGAIEAIQRVYDVVSNALIDEQDCLDSIPENLQASERYEKSEAAADSLSDALEHLDVAMSGIEEAIV